MAKTNLLRQLANDTGEFFLFSQYSEDLTTEMSQMSHYRVVPSKFAVLDLKYNLAGDEGIPASDIWIPTILQNYYENQCEFWRLNLDDSQTEWTPYDASYLLWDTLTGYGFITPQIDNYTSVDTDDVCYELKYIGDINIISNSAEAGVNFNEIYCYIPADAHSYKYSFNYPFGDNDYINKQYVESYIMGWNSDNYPASNPIDENPKFAPWDNSGYYRCRNKSTGFPSGLEPLNYNPIEPEETEDSSFTFNTIILFYDVWDVTNNTKLHQNLPLGIYFTGKPEDTEDSEEGIMTTFNNTVTKYVANDSIYGQGTSYGLRVVTKYICQANTTEFEATAGENDDAPYPEYARAMGRMSEVLDSVQNMINEQTDSYQEIKDHLAQFRNARTNVPYLRLVDGVPYWFVNGRNTGQAAVVNGDEISQLYGEITSMLETLGLSTFTVQGQESDQEDSESENSEEPETLPEE